MSEATKRYGSGIRELRQGACLSLAALLLAGAAIAARGEGPAAGAGVGAAQGEKKRPVTFEELGELARGEGLRGAMHGTNPRLGTYVFTWSNPAGFFENINLSLVPGNAEIAAAVSKLERHQQLRVRGKLVRPAGSQPHVVVDWLEPGEKWNPGVTAAPPAPPADLSRTLAGKSRIRAMVHAIEQDGSALAVEYAGEVIPVQVPEAGGLRKRVGELYRGDRIAMRFRIAEHPKRPLHLRLDAGEGSASDALLVTDAMREQHDQVRTVEGRLVLFPMSPVIRRSIWAVEEPGPDGLHRYFTIFNFADLKDQDRTDAKLRAAWESRPDGVLDGRNKYIHTGVRVRVTGKVNNPAQNQANPALAATSEQVAVL